MKRCLGPHGALTVMSLLLPWWAAAESQLEAGPQNRKLSAAAHVDFKVIIPAVLSLGLGGGEVPSLGAQTVFVFSNSRYVTLAAGAGSMPAAHHTVLLRAAAGRTIAREAACRLPPDAGGESPSKTKGLVCTVSMP